MRSPGRTLARVANRAAVPYVAQRTSIAQAFAAPSPMVSEMSAMGRVGTLFAIVTKCATATAATQWKLWRKAKSGKIEDRVEVTQHLALQIWNKPNAFFPRQEFVETFQQHHELTGEAWWVISRNPLSTLPLELWPVRPDKMQPVPDANDFIVGYIYTGPDGEKVPLEINQVIFIRSPNPMDMYRGMGPVQTVLPDLNASNMAAQYVANFFANSAEPGGIIEVDKRLSDDEFDEMTTRWREQHQGVSNAHRVAVLEQGKWVDRKYTMKDMQMTDLRTASSEVIREAFGFPKPLLGTVDDVNRANAEAAEYVFAKWLVEPRLDRIKSALNNDFLPMFYPPGADPDVEFDYETPVPEDKEFESTNRKAIADTASVWIGLGFDEAEVLEMLNVPAMTRTAVTTPDAPASDPAAVVEAVQKIYLGVGVVLTAEEARTILNEMGADLATTLPEELVKKDPAPAPAPAFGDPADPGADPPPPGSASNRAIRGRHWPSTVNAAKLPDDDHPDLAKLQKAWEDTLDALIRSWDDITAAQKQVLLKKVHDIVSSGTPADLAALSVASEDGAAALLQAMSMLGTDAATHVVHEADAQGVTTHAVPPRADGLAATAKAVAALLAAGLVYSTTRETIRVWNPAIHPDEIVGQVSAKLDALTNAQPKAVLGAALTQAQRQGRMNTLLAAPTSAWYASEQLDSHTCDPCRKVNGMWLGNSIIENVNRLYPTGGYIDCLGGDRCRGMVVGVWRPEQVGDQ